MVNFFLLFHTVGFHPEAIHNLLMVLSGNNGPAAVPPCGKWSILIS
jgi:hypothetical protein